MKKILLTIFILFTTTVLNAADITTIDFIKKNAKNADFFTIKGALTEKLSNKKYIFQDTSGTTKIKIRESALREKGLSELPLNSTITLKVSIDKKFLGDVEFNVFEVSNIETTNSEENFHITSIDYINKNAKNDEYFTIKGVIVQRAAGTKYQFKDESGLAIINIEKSAFRNANIERFNDGDNVILKVKIDKDFAKKMELDVYNIIEYNNTIIR